jgi:signal transduction histidine kinase
MKSTSSQPLHTRTLDEGQISWAIRFLLLISIFLIIILSVSYHSINQELIYYSERVDQSHEVLDKISELNSNINELTCFGRGVNILGDSVNRAIVQKSMAKLPALQKDLNHLVQDNKAQKLKLAQLNQFVKIYTNQIRGLLNDTRIRSSAPEGNEVLLLNDPIRTGAITIVLDQMAEIENKLMTNRLQSRNNYKQQIFRFNWVIMFVALVFLLSSFILLERELKRNKLYKIELENKVNNLNRSNSELEQFAYVASHDLQEPLRKIRSFTDLLLARYDTMGDAPRGMLDKIDKSAIRMQLLIDDLLAFSRIIDTTDEAKEVDLNQVLEEVKNNLLSTLEDKNVQLRAQKLPVVIGFETQLIQLFQNLISNSIKYSRDGIAPRIDILCSETTGTDIQEIKEINKNNPYYCITFRDNGIGFKKEYAEKIFVIFQRLHSQDKFKGSGIGLAICRKVISNHNGYIIAEGEEGKGAHFYVYLPKHTALNVLT